MDLVPDGAIVGRDDVLAGLADLLAAARTGRGRVAVLSGDAGIGKTRLVSELVGAARQAGVRVAVGQCDELDQSVPLAPVAGLLGGLDLDAGSTEDGAAVRTAARAVEALAAAERPALVVAEDLHWCDEASLSVLARVARRAGTLPLLLVLTTRPAGKDPALVALLAGLERQAHAREWALRPLGLDDTGRLVASLLGGGRGGRPPARPFVERVHLITEGNPLFVTALLAALEVSASGGELPDADDLDRVPVPRSVQAAVWQRASRLTEGGRRLVQLAAVAGRAADVDLLAEVGGWDEQALIAHLGDAVGAGLLVDVSAHRVAFGHELTRRAVLADVLARERRAMHLAMARAMERRHGGEVAHAGALAHHFVAAEMWADAGEHAARAGRHALALGAPSAAVDLFTLAVNAAHRTGGVPATDVLAGRGAAYDVVGQFEPARLDFEEVLARAHQSGNAEAECSALLDLGRLWSGRDYGRSGDYYRRALELARRRGTHEVQAEALNRTGSWHLNSERPEQARRHHQEALGLYRAAGDSQGEAATLDLLGTVHLTMGDLGAAAQSYGDAVVRFRADDDRRALGSALAMLTFCSCQYLATPASWSDALTFDEAVAAGNESVELCRTMEWASGEALGHVALASVLGQHGSYGAALEHGVAAQRLAADAGNPYWSLLADLMVGAVHLDLLDASVARDHLSAAFALASELGSDYWKRTVCGFLVDACLQVGDRAAAQAAVEEVAARPGGSHPATMGVRHTLRARAEVAVATGDVEVAHAAAFQLAAAVEVHGPPGPLIQLLRGRVLAAAGSTAEAEAAWREGLAEAEGRKAWPLTWRLNAALGRSLRARRNLDDADRHLLAARAQIDSLAAQVEDPGLRSTFVTAATAMLPTPTGRRATKHAFGGLTAREREVAVLVTDGLSNGQIADHLVVSPRTVEKHVEHVLTKLGLGSRAQIAAWAVRNGLEAEHT